MAFSQVGKARFSELEVGKVHVDIFRQQNVSHRGTSSQSARGPDWICRRLSDTARPRLFIKMLPDTFQERNQILTTLLRAEKVGKVRRSDGIVFIPITP